MPSVAEEDMDTSEVKAAAGTACRCTKRAPTREVTSAADEPSPVLCTSPREPPVCANGGKRASDASRGGRPSSVSFYVDHRL